MNKREFDIVIVGGGHAGLEAAWIASSFSQLAIALVSMPGVPLGSTPCNPAIGGVGKGQVVRELDALGGLMGQIADLAGIQYRILNESKGHAVQSTRVQVDKDLYAHYSRELISKTSLTLIEDEVTLLDQDNHDGFVIMLKQLGELRATKVVLTTGTFLGGQLHSGANMESGGRVGARASIPLTRLFSKVKTLNKRFKTGTPPRLDRKTIDFSALEIQPSDERARNFHFHNDDHERAQKQVNCYLSRTNVDCLDIIRRNKEKSPMYNGQIRGIGPRYCPSIEDKAFRYPDRHEHHVFLEPEGLDSNSVYPNGISTSLPLEVQEQFVRTIKGLESAEILVPGYAVEYDVVDTSRLDHSLMYRELPGLYFAGQVNGTSGYEEAAAQGYVAGVNAALSCLSRPGLKFQRNDCYIGVLIDDLVTSSRDEPYRLFTARSENRLYIREDNTTLRMAPYREALALNLSIDAYNKAFLQQYELLADICRSFRIGGQTIKEMLSRGEVDPVQFLKSELTLRGAFFNSRVLSCVAISLKYEGYISRSTSENERIQRFSHKQINWRELLTFSNISYECKQRIEEVQPETFYQLQKIEGIRPATLVFVAGHLAQ